MHISLGIHSSAIYFFRFGLALLAIFEGIKIGTVHSLLFLSEHRLFGLQWKVYDGDNSNINFFQASESEVWPKFLIVLYIFCGAVLLQKASKNTQWASVILFFLKISINTQACHCCSVGDTFLPALFIMSAYFPTDNYGLRGKWYHTSTTASYYIVIWCVYVTAGLHKLFDQEWRSGRAIQIYLLKTHANDLGLYISENYPTMCCWLTYCTIFLEVLHQILPRR